MEVKRQLLGFNKFWFLFTELVRKGIRLKYRRSYLGIMWSLIEPILTTIVLVLVFGTLFNNKREDFPVYIISGRLLYNFFSSTTKQNCKSVQKNAAMIKKVYVPKYMYPLSDAVFCFIIFIISLLSMIPVMFYAHVTPTWYIWQIIPSMIILFFITLGVGMILSSVNVFFRDIEYLWNVISMLIMYMCAIFYYPEKLLQSGFSWILELNPIYCCIDMFRGGMLGYMAPVWSYGYSLVFAFLVMVFGLEFFRKTQDKFILHL